MDVKKPMQHSNYRKSTQAQQQFTVAPQSLDGKTLLVSGATGGLGTALSLSCARAGANVVLVSRNEKKLTKLYDVIVNETSTTPAMIPLQQDKAGPEDYAKIADFVQAEFGSLDALVHCSADLGTPTPQINIDHAEWVRVMNVNLTSARLLSMYCMPLLMSSTLASLVFLLDYKVSAYWGGYGVSKQALQTLMQMLADETDGTQDNDGCPVLAVNGYDPGPMRTQLRRRAFPGELEAQSEPPETRLGPLLSLVTRSDRHLSGVALCY